jgi:hypothetical protein
MGSSNFSSFKSKSAANFDRLRDELNKTASGNKYDSDDRFWAPERGTDGNDYAVIRFLPARDGEEFPYAKVLSYGFKNKGGWYIENSLATIGSEDDPVDKMRRKLYASGTEADKKLAEAFPRRTNFISNIEIIDYPKKPELNGKRFLFKYGKKIFNKINDAANPKFPDEPRIIAYDFWEGADFVLKVTTQGEGQNKFPNYDKSEFRKPSPHRGGDDKVLEEIWNNLYPLSEFTDPKSKHFKTPAQLQKRLNRVLGLDEDDREQAAETKKEAPVNTAAERFGKKSEDRAPEKEAPAPKTTVVESESPPWKDEDGDEMDYFRRAAASKK